MFEIYHLDVGPISGIHIQDVNKIDHNIVEIVRFIETLCMILAMYKYFNYENDNIVRIFYFVKLLYIF